MTASDGGEAQISSMLGKLTEELKEIASSTAMNLNSLQDEVREIKDQRFRPYITSMSLFLIIVLGVMSYVYNMELKFTRTVFELNDRINDGQLSAARLSGEIASIRQSAREVVTREEERIDHLEGRINRLITRIAVSDKGLYKAVEGDGE